MTAEVLAEHVERDPALPYAHPAEELDAGLAEAPLQHPDHRFHLPVIGRHPIADEP